jgi:IclR family acetate operon transcriptional repressor
LGKVFLAYSEDGRQEELLSGPLNQFTPKTIVGKRDLRAEMTRIRSRGYAVDDEEYIEGVRCIAAPILNSQGLPVALIGISGPKTRICGSRVKEYGEEIRQVSLEISKQFGYEIGSAS